MKYTNEALSIDFPIMNELIGNACDIYKYCNTQIFNYGDVFPCFAPTLKIICNAHKQEFKFNKTWPNSFPSLQLKKMEQNKKVLVLFSGGLDSIYQAMKLREEGYSVSLFHMKNQNKYTNGQEVKVSKAFAEKYNFPIVYGDFKASNGEYKKFWQENSWKNFLLYTLAYSYCIENEIGNISSGDDLRLSINDAVVGTNLSDSRELTLRFMEDMKINFIPCSGDKESRLKYIFDHNLEDDYYSCVSPGRMNQYWHNMFSSKLNVNVEKYNCCICRKCAMHLLLRKYYLHNIDINSESEKYLWERLSIGADNAFFDLSIPLETRIKNLKDY